jgi:predicted nuclease of restriction endonuclease-like RecB superfamily
LLTADLVRVLKRSGRLYVPALTPARRARLVDLADRYARTAAEHAGRTRGELASALDAIEYRPTDHKEARGLRKLLLDRCSFETPDDAGPHALRGELFRRAAEARRSLARGATFDREAVVQATAAALGLETDQVERGLYADLKQNHPLVAFRPIEAGQLVDRLESARRQAVLLRAVRVEVRLSCSEPAYYRAFFGKLKFRRLLHTIERLERGGYRIVIDGPMSLFRSVTKYGLQLALMLPVIEQSGAWELDADVIWDREPLRFHLEGEAPASPGTPARLPDDVQRLLEGFRALGSDWDVEASDEVLDLPGVGLCVPDLAFTHRDTGRRVFLEVMGYWSRDAVWKRVDLVRAGLPHPVVFALSSRLRVSEQVLDDDLPGSLYVYKGVMRPRAVLDCLVESDRDT